MSSSFLSHFIDFFVILFADIGAAYFAITLFEARHEDRVKTESNLSDLYKRSIDLKSFYWKERGRIPSSNFEHVISGSDNGFVFRFTELEHDILFWSFRSAERFKNDYDEILLQIKLAHQRDWAAKVREHVVKLDGQIESLKVKITEHLKPKKVRSYANLAFIAKLKKFVR